MKFRYNIFNLITAIMFILAFLSLMISYATSIMYYFAMTFFVAGFSMLSVILMKAYLKQKGKDENVADPIIMQLSGGVDGEAYVMADEKQNRRERNRKRTQQFDRLLPFIFSVLLSGLFVFLLIKSIFFK